jgi:hypothetical protein
MLWDDIMVNDAIIMPKMFLHVSLAFGLLDINEYPAIM